MKYSALFALCFLVFACGKNEPDKTQTEEPAQTETTEQNSKDALAPPAEEQPGETLVPVENQSQPIQRKDIFQKKLTDGKVTFDVMCRNAETSKYQILGTGFEQGGVRFNGAVEGQLSESHLLDLNNDGFCEIYLVFDQTDDTGNKMIKGFSSYRNKSAGEIYVKDTEMIRQMNTDRVYVEDKKLKRSFKDENGTDVSFEYKLEKGESSFVLTPAKL